MHVGEAHHGAPGWKDALGEPWRERLCQQERRERIHSIITERLIWLDRANRLRPIPRCAVHNNIERPLRDRDPQRLHRDHIIQISGVHFNGRVCVSSRARCLLHREKSGLRAIVDPAHRKHDGMSPRRELERRGESNSQGCPSHQRPRATARLLAGTVASLTIHALSITIAQPKPMPAQAPPITPRSNTPATTARGSRLGKSRAIAVCAVMLVVATALVVLLNPRIVGSFVASRLSDTAGGIVTLDSFRWTGWGSAEIRGVRLSTPNWSGPGSEIAHIDRVQIEVAVFSLVWGNTTIRSLVVDGLQLTAVEDPSGGSLYNFQTLDRKQAGAPAENPVIVERATLNSIAVSIQRLDHGGPVELMSFLATAAVRPSPDDQSLSLVSFNQVEGPIQVSGSFNQTTLGFDLAVAGISIGQDLSLIMPRNFRALVAQAEATGTVKSARLRMSPGTEVHGIVELADFRATLPAGGFEEWVRYENQTISPARGFLQVQLRSGTVEVTGSQLDFRDLDFELVNTAADGRVATLPVRATLTMDLATLKIEAFEWGDRSKWIDKIRAFAPFDLSLMVPKFSLGQTAQETAIEVPRLAAEFMKTFQVTELEFSLQVTASRATSVEAADGSFASMPVTTSGTLSITDGRGAFEDFAYPVHDIRSTVLFSGSRADITSLTGVGPDGEGVTIHGAITNIGSNAGVTLVIAAPSASIDQTLFDSFPARERDLLAGLFWQEGFRSLQSAGVLFDAAQVADAVTELKSCESRLTVMTQSDQGNEEASKIAELATRAGQLQRIIDHGAFTPGGRLAFEFRVSRAETEGAKVDVAGEIRLMHADILTTTFPYPIRASSGVITIRDERLDFGVGIPFRTLDGAEGLFNGHIQLGDTQQVGRDPTQLAFTLTDDQLNPLLFLAIPPDATASQVGWPGARLSRGGTTLSQLDPRGIFSLRGQISIAADGELAVGCDIELRGGSIHPTVATGQIIADEGLSWPVGFGLDDCTGSFRLTDDTVVVNSFSGFRRGGEIEAIGQVSLDGTATDLTIKLRAMELADYAINLLPFDERENAAALWDRYQPTGQFDADIVLTTPRAGGPVESRLAVTPRTFGLTFGGGPIEARFDSGTLHVEQQVVRCDALTGTLSPVGGLPTAICIDGSYGEATGQLDLSGSIQNGLIHGPLIAELVKLLGEHAAKSFMQEFKPEGRYDAQFSCSMQPGRGGDSFELDGWINDLSLGSDAARLSLGFTTPLHIHSTDLALRILPFRASFPGGSIDGCGWLASDGAGAINAGEFSFDLLALGTGADVIAALPAAARDPLTQIGFSCPDILRAATTIRLSPRGELVRTDVASDISIHGASLAMSPHMSQFSANVGLTIASDAEATSLVGEVTNGRAILAGREINNFSTMLHKHETNPEFFIERFHGSMGTGSIAGDARVELAAPHRFEMDFTLMGVPIAALALPRDGVDPSLPTQAGEPGLVSARIGLGGDASGVGSRRGRGSASIKEAELARLPIALAILQVAQLSLALDTVVTEGDFEFTIDQDRLHFDEFKIACRDVVLSGDGWLNTETTELALRLRNRGTLPILSDLLGGVTNQLFQIDVRGTLQEPRGSIAPLPGLIPAPELNRAGPIASASQ